MLTLKQDESVLVFGSDLSDSGRNEHAAYGLIRQWLHAATRGSIYESPAFIVLGAGVLATVVAVSFEVFAKAVDLMTRPNMQPQGQYGRVFADLSKRGVSKVTVLDAGVDNAAGFINYSPQLHFYSVAWAGRGLSTQILHAVEPDKIRAGAVVVTCDPKLIDAVRALGRPVARVRDCAAVVAETAKTARGGRRELTNSWFAATILAGADRVGMR